MSGVLYIVATPIGNLDDISLRAISTLKNVDLIAAEDTRHSRQLLNHLNIEARLLSYHQHNESSRSEELLEKLVAGNDIALISDAGTPLISDPGYNLVSRAVDAAIQVVPVPGANSAIAAVSAAGLPTDSFYYCGFLSSRSNERLSQLKALKEFPTTLVLFESSHRIGALLNQIDQVFSDKNCVVAKELTKLYERFLRGHASEILQQLEQEPLLRKGEFVVLIDNAGTPEQKDINDAERELLKLLINEVSVKAAVKIAVQLTGKKKNDLYQLALELQEAIKS
jgi:16S rRNA (cytidine1402-2'-O)-methyltransferase